MIEVIIYHSSSACMIFLLYSKITGGELSRINHIFNSIFPNFWALFYYLDQEKLSQLTKFWRDWEKHFGCTFLKLVCMKYFMMLFS